MYLILSYIVFNGQDTESRILQKCGSLILDVLITQL
jgi:hypothetical protein